MKRIGLLLTLVAVLALPGAALAQGGKGVRGPAPKACAQIRSKMGVANFRAAFAAGHRPRAAFGKCVREQRRAGQRLRKLALEQCRQGAGDNDPGAGEGDDPGEGSDEGDDDPGDDSGDELDAEGGATKSLADCVTDKLKRLSQAQNERYAKAARTCRTQLAARGKARSAARGRAFARCVRAHVRPGNGDRAGDKPKAGDDDNGAGDDNGTDQGDDGDDPGDGEIAEDPGDDAEE